MGVNLPSRFALFPNRRRNSSSGIGGPFLSIAHYNVFYTPFVIFRQETPHFLNTSSFVRSEQKRPFLRPDHAIAWPPRAAKGKGSSQGTRLQGAKRPKMGWKIPFRGASTAGSLRKRESQLADEITR